jgi:PAS domain-containing protein
VRNAAEWDAFRVEFCAAPPAPSVLQVPAEHWAEYGERPDPDWLVNSARRSKALMRRRAMAYGLTRIFTLTTREALTDRGLLYVRVKEWARRLQRVAPRFACAWTDELQKRGAWHSHLLATPPPTWVVTSDGLVRFNKVAAAIWARVCEDLGGGNFDSGERYTDKRTGRRMRRRFSRSPLKAVNYVCKYVTKDLQARTGRRFHYSCPDRSLVASTVRRVREFTDRCEALAWAWSVASPEGAQLEFVGYYDKVHDVHWYAFGPGGVAPPE